MSSSIYRDGTFSSKCNHEMVALESVVKEIDTTFIREHLEEFVKLTGSEVAKSVLDNWDAELKNFVKVLLF